MKAPYFLTFLAAAVSAQNAGIGFPTKDQEITAGENLVVQIQRPNSLTGSKEMGVAIGVASCASRPCMAPKDTLGTLLYNGPFKPEYHETSQPPYQNFTVTIPDSIAKGDAQINVAHVAIVGASAWPYLDLLNQTVVVA
ncbi:hypothetical protein ANOM_002819 [Aspergillus nomiae NRRL 13137]|uniref:Uncharacterized protein n=1 Tax=Aspergillus nomiae NRRL (strain ATCC 15546 / NRRL 13137 / CBS 260.88 / M93) TaxID=1509407 RepID=A0A0L1JAL0_ASPN3|nr:uncharacterized protein ANOM_002819 [Aspergillus nomiae NRRL 13137]KNG88757.1 hypothetical protein ANOM_002819 [Aspergillus nomiae NRRL 13137]